MVDNNTLEIIEKYLNDHPSLGFYLTKDKKYVASINQTIASNRPKTLNYFYNHILPKEYRIAC